VDALQNESALNLRFDNSPDNLPPSKASGVDGSLIGPDMEAAIYELFKYAFIRDSEEIRYRGLKLMGG
jgi:hypothetical protein